MFFSKKRFAWYGIMSSEGTSDESDIRFRIADVISMGRDHSTGKVEMYMKYGGKVTAWLEEPAWLTMRNYIMESK